MRMIERLAASLFIAFKRTALGRALDRKPVAIRSEDLPRRIYIYWNRGLDAAPEICRFCAESWAERNPGWTIRRLKLDATRATVDPSRFPADMGPAHYADLLRVHLLAREGGVWVDATTLCIRPLDDWLPELVGQTGFFAFAGPGRSRVVANWFLAAHPGNALMGRWSALCQTVIDARARMPEAYFWQHYLFEYLVRFRGPARRAWARTPRLSARPAHRMQSALVAGGLAREDVRAIARTGVQKLSHRVGLDLGEVRVALASVDREIARSREPTRS